MPWRPRLGRCSTPRNVAPGCARPRLCHSQAAAWLCHSACTAHKRNRAPASSHAALWLRLLKTTASLRSGAALRAVPSGSASVDHLAAKALPASQGRSAQRVERHPASLSSSREAGGAARGFAAEEPATGSLTDSSPAPADACYGCGATVQAELPQAAGYVPASLSKLKRTHRQRGQLLCRCSPRHALL